VIEAAALAPFLGGDPPHYRGTGASAPIVFHEEFNGSKIFALLTNF